MDYSQITFSLSMQYLSFYCCLFDISISFFERVSFWNIINHKKCAKGECRFYTHYKTLICCLLYTIIRLLFAITRSVCAIPTDLPYFSTSFLYACFMFPLCSCSFLLANKEKINRKARKHTWNTPKWRPIKHKNLPQWGRFLTISSLKEGFLA